jgi:portal protein
LLDDVSNPVEDVDPFEDMEDDDILDEAKALFNVDKSHWEIIYDKARDDLDFLSDDEEAQWDEETFADRAKTGRPTITVDQLSQFVHQVANNIRMNTPSINPLPSGSGASIETADMLKGLIRSIEYNSRADEVYDSAATSAVKCSIGFVLVDHEYADDSTFDQVLVLKRVINPFLVYMDSNSIESDGRDQNHATVLERIKAKQFRIEYPDKDVTSFEDDDNLRVFGDDEEVTIAQFFIKRHEMVDIEGVSKTGDKVKRSTKKTTIERYKLSGTQVLERTTFPGCYIPVVPFMGEEAWKDGKRYIFSLIRKSKMAQQMFNLMQSVEYEILMKQPIAPVMVPAGAIENYADDWKDPSKSMALRYDVFDGQDRQLPPPQRLAPPQVPEGIVNASSEAINNIKATMGLYNQNLGQQGQEISGVAINARKIQGDVATYHFGDNAVRSITQIGTILVCAIPEIYDGERIVQIMNEEDEPATVGINGATVDGQTDLHLLTQGKYDIRVTTGSSFATRRQESASFYEELVKANPQMLQICGDLLFQNMDIAGAPAMAARMKKLIDPKLLQDDQGQGTPQEQALQAQLNQAKQIIQQGAQALQQMQQQLKDKNAPLLAKQQNEAAKLQQDSEKSKMDMLLKMGELAIKDRANDINEQKNAGMLALAEQGQNVDQLLQVMDAITKALPENNSPAMGNLSANNGGSMGGL